MTFETVSVRMNRSDHNIRWGFSVRQQADGLIIDRVDPESLSDRAGVKHNDKVEQINGRPTRGLDASSANRLIDDSFNEVRLSLQRFVTSHTTLPWTLSEKDNKMVVEDMKSGFGSGFGGGTTHFNQNNSSNHFSGSHGFNNNSAATNHFNSSNIHNQSHHQQNQSSNYYSSSSHNSSSGGHQTQNYGATNIPTTVVQSRAPFSNNTIHNQGNYKSDQHIDSTTNYINPSKYNYNSTPTGFGSHDHQHHGQNGHIPQNNFGASKPSAPTPTSYSYNNGTTTQNYGTGSGGTPLNQLTFINTTNHNNPSVNGGLSPGKVFYHSPSGRSRNELSPGASVHHLQYNSPMNLYSSEAVAEQYEQQTGRSPEGPVPHDKKPAYLTSETKKLIEEEARGRNNRGKSPSSQSSCFKRISHAVGADN